ncbi:uncharacterized protein L3040_004659 [Drepanopeziza brunnea f. sp. 'multigermtubi']|uniref:uncharacterized protein n=1 Tax=Drepanopeziza brunnea f. sp. 'multigermtubi' TaxID=698441 RepID=UPI00239FFBF8|nr:hypothetical protein L3040_004659 [Drepanopeziza brunnea f. sp. 'multigermtubi']
MGDIITIHTSTLFDPRKKAFLADISLIVSRETGLVTGIFARDDDDALPEPPLPEPGSVVVDLRGKVVVPGFVDAHAYLSPRDQDGSEVAVVPVPDRQWVESVTERIIRAMNRCRTALLSGYTTYRELGSSSMPDFEFDVEIRDAISRELMPGPRHFVATRPLASAHTSTHRIEKGTSRYLPPPGSEVLNGLDEIRRAVLLQIAAGTDVIALHADCKKVLPVLDTRSSKPRGQQHPYTAGILSLLEKPERDYVVFAQEEMDAVVSVARAARRPVAALCRTLEGAMAAIKAGVRSIEYGYGIGGREGVLRAMAEKSVILVPNLASTERSKLPALMAQTKRAFELGVRIACGGGTGGDVVREMELLLECGIPLEDVLENCTVGGWEACGGEMCGKRFGWFEAGAQADIVALDGDPRIDKGALRKVSFVMKDARIWRMDGIAVGMV